MSEPEATAKKFLLRWSQRKQAAQERADHATAPDDEPQRDVSDQPVGGTAEEAAPPAFDPETLPPIESITAISDVRAFLAPGVPEELTRAALRRVWVSDPTIRDFVGIAENQWDFTQPDSVPGFGSLQLTPQLRKMIADLVGEASGEGGQDAPAGRDEPSADIAEYSMPPMNCAGSEQQQKANAAASDAFLPQSSGAADVSVPPSSQDHGAAQQSRDDNAASEPHRPRRHGSAVPK
jgi:hypothetical protein